MWRHGLTVGAAIAVLAAGAIPAPAQEDFRWSGRPAAGQRLEVRGVSGDVVATLASGDEAEVVATKRGRRSDFDEVTVEVFEEADAIVVCAVYGERRGSSCHGRHDGRDGRDRGDPEIRVSVDFEVRLPAGVELLGATVSGNVVARGLRSDVTARTVSGDVRVSTTGVARGGTVSGDVDIEMGSLDWTRLDFRTVSGDIVVGLPAGVDADVEFESLSGDLDSDFDMAVERVTDHFVGSALRGTIGDGGRRLTLQTVSGDVRLRRSSTRLR